MIKIKICGLKRRQDIEYVNAALPDYAGFVFAGSKRRVSPEQAADLKKELDAGIIAVGVFVDEPVKNIAALVQNGIIDAVQLHGNEDGEYIKELRRACADINIKKRSEVCGRICKGNKPFESDINIIKAVRVESVESIKNADALDADFLLLDNGAGGTGKAFDWSVIAEAQPISKPFFLAGGIGSDNIERAVDMVSPFGVDMSSSVETDGVKDFEKIREAVRLVRQKSNGK